MGADPEPERAAKATRIRSLNDAFRKSMTGGQVLVTAGVDALPSDVKAMVVRRVATFDDFNEDVVSRWRAVSRCRDRFRHPALRTGRASFPASGSLCAAHGLRVGLMVAMAR
jgi:hypothetical protein